MRKKLAFLFALVLILCGMCVSDAGATLNKPQVVSLRFLATSDTHGMFMPWSYPLNQAHPEGSMAQVASAVGELRNKNTIVIDAGDLIQDNSAYVFLDQPEHPMVTALNAIGYDAVEVGNHEFNYGMPTLTRVLKQIKAPVLCGNVYSPEGQALGKRYVIVERAGLKIALLGVVTPNIGIWDKTNLQGWKVTDPIDELRHDIDELKGKVDMMVGVMHMSITNEYDIPHTGAEDIAKACPELDLIIASHGHLRVPGKLLNNVLTVENENSANTLAQIDVKLVRNNDNKQWKVVERKSCLVDMKDYPVDPKLEKLLAPSHERGLADARQQLGTVKGGDFVPQPEIKGLSPLLLMDTPLMDLINHVQQFYAEADSSACPCLSDKANLKEGPISKADLSLIYKFDNLLYKFLFNGAQLKQLLEVNARFYNQYQPGDLTISFNPAVRTYQFYSFTGFKYDIDISKPVGQRIINLRKLDGTPIKDTDELTMACNNYMSTTMLMLHGTVYPEGMELPKLLGRDIRSEVGTVRDMIIQYISQEKKGEISPECGDYWHVVGTDWDQELHLKAVDQINRGLIQLISSPDGRTPNVRAIRQEDLK